MTLDQLIAALEAHDPSQKVPLGFWNPHSYRGNYAYVAFEPKLDTTIGEMLAEAKAAVGATYYGWKGGECVMRGYTDCYIAVVGCCGEEIGPILLAYTTNTTDQVDLEDR